MSAKRPASSDSVDFPETPSKKTKIDKYERKLQDFPTEILEMIFDFLDGSTRSMRVLSASCQRFNEIIQRKFILVITNRINQFEQIKFSRSYDYIEFFNCHIDHAKLSDILNSSSESARTLEIIQCQMHEATLQKILILLPNLEKIVLDEVKFVPAKLCFQRFDHSKFPNFSNLKSLTLYRVNFKFLKCFTNVTELEELRIEECTQNIYSKIYISIIQAPKNLLELSTNIDLLKVHHFFPKLKKLTLQFKGKKPSDLTPRNLLSTFPKLEVLILLGATEGFCRALLKVPNPTLKEVTVDNKLDSPDLKALPALKKFKSANSTVFF